MRLRDSYTVFLQMISLILQLFLILEFIFLFLGCIVAKPNFQIFNFPCLYTHRID